MKVNLKSFNFGLNAMQQLTETIDYVRGNYRCLLKLGFTSFPPTYVRSFTEPESGYVVDCTIELFKTRKGYNLDSLFMEWPKNPLALHYIPVASLKEILELVNKLHEVDNHIAFSEVGALRTITLDEYRKLDLPAEKISYLDFHSKKFVRLQHYEQFWPERERTSTHERRKVIFAYDGKKEEIKIKSLSLGVIPKKNKPPLWSARLRVKNPRKQDLELITQIFDITVKSVKS
jgi:hypothetical protein